MSLLFVPTIYVYVCCDDCNHKFIFFLSFQSVHHSVHEKKNFFFTTILLHFFFFLHAELMLAKCMNMECIVCCHHLTVIITFRAKKTRKKEGMDGKRKSLKGWKVWNKIESISWEVIEKFVTLFNPWIVCFSNFSQLSGKF